MYYDEINKLNNVAYNLLFNMHLYPVMDIF